MICVYSLCAENGNSPKIRRKPSWIVIFGSQRFQVSFVYKCPMNLWNERYCYINFSSFTENKMMKVLLADLFRRQSRVIQIKSILALTPLEDTEWMWLLIQSINIKKVVQFVEEMLKDIFTQWIRDICNTEDDDFFVLTLNTKYNRFFVCKLIIIK